MIPAFIFTYLFLSFFSMFMFADIRNNTSELEKKDVLFGFLWPLAVISLPLVIVGVCIYQVGKPFFKKNSQKEESPAPIPIKETPIDDNYKPLIEEVN